MNSAEFNKACLRPLKSLGTIDKQQLRAFRSVLKEYKWGKNPNGNKSRNIDPLPGILEQAFAIGVSTPGHLAKASGVERERINTCCDREVSLTRSHRKRLSGALKAMVGLPTSFTRG